MAAQGRWDEERGDSDPSEWTAALGFILANGQSLDWILAGDPRGMIARGAAQSWRAPDQIAV
jgi:hypothetical protein